MRVRVRVLNSSKSLAPSSGHETAKATKVLTCAYVREFNRGISHRIQQRELSHAGSADLAAKARFR